VDDLRKVTRNPLFLEQQIKAIFSTRWEETAEALRGILTPQAAAPDDLSAFGEEVRRKAEQGQAVVDAVDGTLEAARFSNSRAVRTTAKEIRSIFKSWRPVTQQGTSYVNLDGTRIELFNALDVLSLTVRLIWLSDLQRERAGWLTIYQGFATGDAGLDQDQTQASAIAIAEADEAWVRRGDIILGFVKDNAVNLGLRLTSEALAKGWVNWSWKTFGKRTTGHLVAGAASAVLLGFTLGNLLYGLDDLFNNFKTGERADELRRRFRDGRLLIQTRAPQRRADNLYDGNHAAQFRAAYMLESLAAAQMYRSYANGVEATVRQNLLGLINPINWFRGKEWREAVKTMREVADSVERTAEDEIGHPRFLDAAVDLALARLAQPKGAPNASAVAGMIYDIILSGEKAALEFRVQNTGQTAWPVGDCAFVGLAGNPAAAPSSLALSKAVQPGDNASWSLQLSMTGTPGVRRLRYQMQCQGKSFGDVITGYVFILPPQMKDLEVRLRRQIEEWQQQGQQAVEELVQRLAEEIQRELEKQARGVIENLTRQCQGAALLSVGALWIAYRGRRRSPGGKR
jgi:hypothetical protein